MLPLNCHTVTTYVVVFSTVFRISHLTTFMIYLSIELYMPIISVQLFKYEAHTALFKDPFRSSVAAQPFKDEAQAVLFKDPVRSSVAA